MTWEEEEEAGLGRDSKSAWYMGVYKIYNKGNTNQERAKMVVEMGIAGIPTDPLGRYYTSEIDINKVVEN